MEFKITPRSLALSFFQVLPDQSIPVRDIIHVGAIFGFSGNTIRVTITRLTREGYIESDERGRYRLTAAKTLVSRFINLWREGESRTVSWKGAWIGCLLSRTSIGKQSKSRKALSLMGFREGLPRLWIRPDNLEIGIAGAREIAKYLGIDPDAEMFVADCFDSKLTDSWRRFLWPLEELPRKARALIEKLEKSSTRLANMPQENALVESYMLGSEAIYTLVTDPLLPDEILQGAYRVALTNRMLKYDTLGKRLWARRFDSFMFDMAPSHLQLLAEG